MTASTASSYTVEILDRPYAGGRIPWWNALKDNGLSERQAITRYTQGIKWFSPEFGSNSWSGHVRIVGSDGWTYSVEPARPGGRRKLVRLTHLNDLA
jgi:hypothetical protein